MGGARKDTLRLDFDRRLKVEFHGTKVTSDAGMPAYRKLEDTRGLTSTVEELPKHWILGELACARAFCRAVSAMLVIRYLEIEGMSALL